jgi:hypothetical protein
MLLWALLIAGLSLVASEAMYEVGKYRAGRNCGHYDDHRFPNVKRVVVPFLNEEFTAQKKPVVVATVQRPADKTGYLFGVNIIMVDRHGFMAEVQRLDVGSRGPMEEFRLLGTQSSPRASRMPDIFTLPFPNVQIEGISKISEGWCFDEVDIHWMAYAPTNVKTVE